MPGSTMTHSKGFFRGLNPLWWGLWLALVIWACYETRFWINNDTIGSLDVARSLRQLDWRQAINVHWGMVYAFLLSGLPLTGAGSWVQIHFLNGILLVGAQILLYISLERLGVRRVIATLLCLAWGAANFAAGGAIFITSDVTFCFVGSLYLYVLVRARTPEKIAGYRNALLLGLLHVLALLTKNIALLGLAVIPLLVSLNLSLKKKELFRTVTFLTSYCLPIILVMAVWGVGMTSKYGRLSWEDSGAFMYATFVDQSPELFQSIEAARHRLPPYGTYWFSDISLSLTNWDHRIHLNLPGQWRVVSRGIKHFFSSLEIVQGLGLLSLMLLGLTGLPALAYWKTADLFLLLMLGAVFSLIFLMCLSVLLTARYLAFPVMFLLPAAGLWLENLFQRNYRTLKVLLILGLIFSLVHGIGATVYASLRLAPQGEHFAMAKFIKDRRGPHEDPGPLGAFLYPQANLLHHGVIAHLLETRTAELSKINDNFSFSASFMPKIVLLVLPAESAIPISVAVNSKHFVLAHSWVWGKLHKREKLVLYNPDEKPRR